PLVNPGWLSNRGSFLVPAGAKRVVHSFVIDPRLVLFFLHPDLDTSHGLVVHSALLHMHRLGKAGRIAVERGRREILLSIRRWDFHWQREYFLASPEPLALGDQLSIRCEHDNSAAHQPLIGGKRPRPRTRTWGENSSDEMCIGFLYVSAR
ncbi:MAG: monooxygenase, partial [Thermoleophilia bacterium]|nr:monooxygenase [Thermoleophilia bacterium]